MVNKPGFLLELEKQTVNKREFKIKGLANKYKTNTRAFIRLEMSDVVWKGKRSQFSVRTAKQCKFDVWKEWHFQQKQNK